MFLDSSSTAKRPDSTAPRNWEEMISNKPGDIPRHLDREDAIEIINASAFAEREGKPHLVMLTIRWSMSRQFNIRDWMECQGRLFDKMSRWLRRNEVPVSFVWLREMGRVHGPHTHVLLHLPVQHWRNLESFLMDAGEFGEPDVSGSPLVLSGGQFGTRTPAMRAGHLRYMLKSLDPATMTNTGDGKALLMDALGVHDGGERRLPIPGKRCGTSYSIGRTMRRNFGWQELRTAEELRTILHPSPAGG